MNSIPIAMTINPIILDNAFTPDAPSAFTIILELISRIKVSRHIDSMAVTSSSLSAINGFS